MSAQDWENCVLNCVFKYIRTLTLDRPTPCYVWRPMSRPNIAANLSAVARLLCLPADKKWINWLELLLKPGRMCKVASHFCSAYTAFGSADVHIVRLPLPLVCIVCTFPCPSYWLPLYITPYAIFNKHLILTKNQIIPQTKFYKLNLQQFYWSTACSFCCSSTECFQLMASVNTIYLTYHFSYGTAVYFWQYTLQTEQHHHCHHTQTSIDDCQVEKSCRSLKHYNRNMNLRKQGKHLSKNILRF